MSPHADDASDSEQESLWRRRRANVGGIDARPDT